MRIQQLLQHPLHYPPTPKSLFQFLKIQDFERPPSHFLKLSDGRVIDSLGMHLGVHHESEKEKEKVILLEASSENNFRKVICKNCYYKNTSNVNKKSCTHHIDDFKFVSSINNCIWRCCYWQHERTTCCKHNRNS